MHPSTAARLDGSLTGTVLNAFADTWCVVTTWGVWCCSCRLCQCVSQRKLKISRRGFLSPVLDSREAPAKRVRPLNRSGDGARCKPHTQRVTDAGHQAPRPPSSMLVVLEPQCSQNMARLPNPWDRNIRSMHQVNVWFFANVRRGAFLAALTHHHGRAGWLGSAHENTPARVILAARAVESSLPVLPCAATAERHWVGTLGSLASNVRLASCFFTCPT